MTPKETKEMIAGALLATNSTSIIGSIVSSILCITEKYLLFFPITSDFFWTDRQRLFNWWCRKRAASTGSDQYPDLNCVILRVCRGYMSSWSVIRCAVIPSTQLIGKEFMKMLTYSPWKHVTMPPLSPVLVYGAA